MRGAATQPRLLLLGATGQLGSALQRTLAPLGEVIMPDRHACDLYDPAALQRTLAEAKPNILVNAAAYTDVDAAEHHTASVMQINTQMPERLAEWATRHGAWLLHFSSDYVFDGRLDRPYREDDAAAPLNTYGRSKLAADELVAQTPRHLIVRSGWICHRQGRNFLRTILRRARQQSRLQVVADQFGAPNTAELLAQVSTLMLRDAWHERGAPGLYHVAASGRASWHDYAVFLLEEAARQGMPLRCHAADLQSIDSAMLTRLAPRPASTVLDTSHVRGEFGIHLPPWQQGVSQVVHDILQGADPL